MTDQVKHLLGGYATGTLTSEENAALMRAALEDQELFDALADDEALRRYLADATFRKDLLKATAPKPTRMRWIAALSTAAACVLAAFVWTTHRTETPTQEIALSRPSPVIPPPIISAPAQPAPAKPTARRKAKMEPAFSPPPTAESGPKPNADGVSVPEAKAAPSPAAPAGSAFAPRSVQSFAAAPPVAIRPPVNARVTDVNATILTIDAGSDAGVRTGDSLEVFHENSPIGFLTITTAAPTFSAGKYSGVTSPAIGDTATTPKK